MLQTFSISRDFSLDLCSWSPWTQDSSFLLHFHSKIHVITKPNYYDELVLVRKTNILKKTHEVNLSWWISHGIKNSEETPVFNTIKTIITGFQKTLSCLVDSYSYPRKSRDEGDVDSVFENTKISIPELMV